jgi:multicomponent Na+:H+ antiporter subunit G
MPRPWPPARGVIAVLAASVATENPTIITFAVLTIAFVVLTSPVSGHAIARAAHRRAPVRDDQDR